MASPEVDGLNSGYARLLLEQYLENPEAVPEEWRDVFESGDSELVATHPGLARLLEHLRLAENGDSAPAEARPAPAPAAPAVAPDEDLLAAVAAGTSLIKAFRTHGHLAAHLDPLGSEPVGDPALEPESLGLTPELMEQIPASILRVYVSGESLAEVLPHMKETYCGTMAFETEHISNHEERVWLRKAIESGHYRTPLAPEEKK